MWCDAIDAGNYTTCPGLMAQLFHKYLGPSKPSIKGHLYKSRQNQISIKKPSDKPHPIPGPQEIKKYVKRTASKPRSHQVYYNMVEVTGKIYSDQMIVYTTTEKSSMMNH